uniref:Double homeobox B n=1 Tax=Catagonus wagneri TaxID=51154 RepID=A0A8C3VSA8_9CETA
MDFNSTPSDKLQKETWQGRIVYNQSQKSILQARFEHDPYPEKATRKQWAWEIGVPESKIQIWLKNHRAKQRKLGFSSSLEEDKTHGQDQPQPCTQEYLCRGARQDQTSNPRSQSNVPVQAFERKQFLDIGTRATPAKQTAIPESRIQMWFQDQRSLYPGQSRSEHVNSSVNSPNGRPGLTVQQHEIDLSTLPGRSHFLSSSSFSRSQSFQPVLPCVIQGQTVMMQPMQVVQGGEDRPFALTLGNYMPVLLTMGGDPDTPAPFWPQHQEDHQDHQEETATGVLQLGDYSQSQPEHKKPPPQDLGDMDISYILQCWDEACQALLAEWDPRKGTH